MDEKRKNEIKKEAREMLDRFGRALDKVKVKVNKDEISDSYRKEGKVENYKNGEFRKLFFSNVPKMDGECIVAERGHW